MQMENKQSIMLIACAIFSIVILLAQGNIEKVFALSSVDVTGLSANTKCVDNGTSVYYYIVDSCQAGNLSTVQFTRYKFSDNSIVNSFAIKSLKGNLTSGITTSNSGNDGTVGVIKCSGNYCWVGRTGTVQYQLQKWNTVTGLPVNYLNFSVAGTNRLEHRALVIGNNEIWGAVQCTTDATRYIPTAWSTDDGTVSGLTRIKQIGATSCNTAVDIITNSGAGDVNLCIDCGGTSGKMRVVYGAPNAAGSDKFFVFDGVALVRKCASTLASTTTNTRGVFSYLGNTIDKWAVGTDSNTVLIINNNDACSTNTTITNAELGSPANYIKGIDVNIHNAQWMVYHSSTTLAKVAVMDLTSLANLHNLVITLAGVGSGMEPHSFFATDSNLLALRNKVFETTTSTTGRMWTLDDTGANPSEEGGTSAFCQIPANENLLTCVLERQGGALGGFQNQTNPFNPISGTNGIIVSALGLTNSDVKTNGVGYILLAISLILFNALTILSITIAGGKYGFHLGSFDLIWLMLVVSLAVEAGFILMGITDVTFFIITVVALIALATPRIVGIFGGRGGSA